jgi:hypothetical protein
VFRLNKIWPFDGWHDGSFELGGGEDAVAVFFDWLFEEQDTVVAD